jgi:uncharacterized membrane protein YeaQ/YmgE (transglycosylase-associated protein family)
LPAGWSTQARAEGHIDRFREGPAALLRQWVTVPSSERTTKGDEMHYLWTVIVGLIVGALAKLFMPGKDPGGFIVTILIGIAGSLVAGFIGKAAHLYSPGQAPGIIASILGAMVLLLIYRLVVGRRAAV